MRSSSRPPAGTSGSSPKRRGEAAGFPNQVRIRIRDTGVGIAPDLLPKIFDMFMQGDVSLERTRAGLGVGLTLVRNLVALHGGTVDVHSDGEGSRQRVHRVPAARSARYSRHATAEDPGARCDGHATVADPRR